MEAGLDSQKGQWQCREAAMKCARKVRVGAMLAALTCTPTYAADDLTLVRILARADIAHDLAYYCAQYDSSIINRTRSSVGDAQALMLHIRSEVISDLPQNEAAQIVLRSANAARTGALLAIRRLYGQNRKEERARLADWCERTVVPSLKEFVAWHDQHHEMLDQAIESAKQGAQAPLENPSSKAN
jgi:hypothetical protein